MLWKLVCRFQMEILQCVIDFWRWKIAEKLRKHWIDVRETCMQNEVSLQTQHETCQKMMKKCCFFCHVQKWSFSSVGNHNDLTPCWGLKSWLIQLHEDIFIFEKFCEFNCIWAWWSHGVDCWNWQKFL